MTAVSYLKNSLIPSVMSDVVVVAAQGIGHHGVPRNVFCYVDHLGHLAYGEKGPTGKNLGSTERAVTFLREFFPIPYQAIADLIYDMWRHGVVHEHKPRSLHGPVNGVKNGVTVRWVSTNHVHGREVGLHLLVYPVKDFPGEVSLVMNNFRLAKDLVCSIQNLIASLEGDAAMRGACDVRVANFGQVRHHTAIRDEERQIAIAREIAATWQNRGGLINELGIVVTPHPEEGKN